MRLRKGMRRLRAHKQYRAVRRALHHVNQRAGFRVCEFSIQGNHYHLIVEAMHRVALARGMQALNIRIARALNRIAGARKGTVFADRYHSRVITTPRHARNALAYVLNNGRRHREDWQKGREWVDPCSSAEYFGGWMGVPARRACVVDDDEVVLRPARSWLLTAGWKRHGRIDPREVPGPAQGWGS
jgi:REP element-mobilizing transposase RayT